MCCIELEMMVVVCVLHWLVRIVRTSCPDSPGLRMQTHLLCVHDLSYAFMFDSLVHTHSPHCILYKERLELYLLPLFDIWEVEFEIRIHGILLGEALYISELHLFWLSNEVHGVVINHQKGGDWKESRPLSGFWCLTTKPCTLNVLIEHVCRSYGWINAWEWWNMPLKKGNEKAVLEINPRIRFFIMNWV